MMMMIENFENMMMMEHFMIENLKKLFLLEQDWRLTASVGCGLR